MGTTRQLGILGWLVLTIGCGANVSVGQPDSDPAATTTSPPPATLCRSAEVDGSTPLMTVVDEERAAVLRADGSLLELDLGSGPASFDGHTANALGRGNYVATTSTWLTIADGIHATSIVKLFDAQGRELARFEVPGYDTGVLDLDANGRALLSRYAYGSDTESDYVVASPSGELKTLGNFIGGGWVAGHVLRGYAGDIAVPAFMNPDSGSVELVDHAAEALWTQPWGDGFVLLHPGMTAPWLFYATPEGEQLVVLWDVESDASELSMIGATAGYLLLRNDVDGRLWRISVPDGEVLALPSAPPSGPTPGSMEYCAPSAMLASDGSVVLVGGADTLSFQRFEPTNNVWTQLGNPVTEVEMVGFSELDGTYLLQGAVGTYCPGPVGEPAEGALSGSSMQVVRPSIGAHHQLPINPWDYVTIRPGGECVAYADGDGMHVLDVGGEDVRLKLEGGFSWWRTP